MTKPIRAGILPGTPGPTNKGARRCEEQVMQEWLADMISNPYMLIVLLTFFPFLELRASIPYGILVAKQPCFAVVITAIVANIILGPILYFLLDKMLHLLIRIRVVDWFWSRMIIKTQKKVHPLVEKYGTLGLSVFIGIPLPGSGVYSGAIGGYLLGFTRKEFYIATVLGVLTAATAVTAIVLTGSTTFEIFLKK